MYEALAEWPAGTDANAVALGFRADLGSGHEVTNLPGRAPEGSSWAVVVFAPIPGAGPDPELPARLTVRWTGRHTQLLWSCGDDD